MSLRLKNMAFTGLLLLGFAQHAYAMDFDGGLVAATAVSEPVSIPSTATGSGSAVDVFDFSLLDGGTADGLALDVSAIALYTSGSASAALWAKLDWRLNGPGVSNAPGAYSSATNELTFSALSISIIDGGSADYIVSAFFNDNTGLTDGATFGLSVNGSADVVVSAAGTQMGATTAVNNGAGSAIDITATQLVYSTAPAGSISGIALTTQPIVEAQDGAGNTDKDFIDTITITEDLDSNGAVSNNSAAAVEGVATFTSLIYTATDDTEDFKLEADDTGALPSVTSATVVSDVQATKLVFVTQPTPQSFDSGTLLSLAANPVVHALNDQDLIDKDFSAAVELSKVGGAGALVITGTGDTDGNGDTVTLNAIAGVVTYTGLDVTYTVSGMSSESFKLIATSALLTAGESSTLVAVVSGGAPEVTSVQRHLPTGELTNSDELTWRVSFSEDVTGLDVGDFEVTGTTAALSVISVGGSAVYDLKLAGGDLPGANGVVTIGFAAAADVVDVDSNALSNFVPLGVNDNSYTLDNIAPTFLVSAPDRTVTRNTPVLYVLTFSGASEVQLDADSGQPDRVTVNTTGTAVATALVAGDGSGAVTREVRLSGLSGDGDVSFNVVAGVARDLAGNESLAYGPSTAVSVDNTPPSIAVAAPSLLLTTTTDVSYVVSYSGAIQVSLAAADVSLVTAGTANGVVTITGAGATTRTVTISNITGNGSLSIQLAANTAEDEVGNNSPAVASSTPFQVDNIAPSISISAPSLTATKNSPVTYTVDYTGADAVTLSNANVTLTKTGTANGSIAVSGAGLTTRTVTVSSITGDGTLGISVVAGTASDTAGNIAPAVATSSTFDVDNSAPRIVSITREAPVGIDTNADSLVWQLSFDGDVNNVDITDFSVSGTTATVTSVAPVTGSSVYDLSVSGGDLAGLNGTINLSFSATQDIVDIVGQALSNTTPTGVNHATYEIDNTPPTVLMTLSDTTLVDGETSVLTLTFSEPVMGFSVDDLTPDNGTLSAFSVDASDNKKYTVLFTPSPAFSGVNNNIHLLGIGFSDAAGNTGSDTDSPAFVIADRSLDSINALIAAADGNDGSSISLIVLSNVFGLNNLVPENLAAYQAAIAAVTQAEVDTALEIQALITSVNVIEQIKLAAANDEAGHITFIAINSVIGVDGAIIINEAQYQVSIAEKQSEDVDTSIKIQALVTSVNVLQRIATAALTNDASGILEADLNGVTGVTGAVLANEALYQAVIGGSSQSQVDIAEKIQVLVKQVNAISAVMAYADDNAQPEPAIEHYLQVGIRGVTAANLSEVNLLIDNLSGVQVDTKEKIQAAIGLTISDSDADGIADINDLDDDNDGILDSFENDNSQFLTKQDIDTDGIDDGIDTNFESGVDDNRDGIIDERAPTDTDQDGIPDYLDADSDNDGLLDTLEYASLDADGDGRVDGFVDSNDDGLHDSSTSQPVLDTDGDGVVNTRDTDSDGDNQSDLAETAGIELRAELDKDNDGIADKDVDADRDGVFDSVDPVNSEAVAGIKLVPTDSDGDGVVDYLDSDAVDAEEVVDAQVQAEPGPRKTASINYIFMLILYLFTALRITRFK